MKALVYKKSIPRYLLGKLLTKLAPRRFFPSLSPLFFEDVPLIPPGKDWLIVKPLMCGICGSDLALLKGSESFLLEPYGSFPAILGHETFAEISAVPNSDGPWKNGDRVVIEPVLHCALRGLPPCPSCRRGDWNLCENFLNGDLESGPVQGINASAGGGMAEYQAAHPASLIRVPDNVSDEDAVLVDSIASALQPVLENFPPDDATVVVFGAGIIGQHVIRCLRALGSKAHIIAAARHPAQKELALTGGADEILASTGRRDVAAALGADYLPTCLGGGNIEGGADYFFDCVGSTATFQEGLLALRAKGTYIMVGTASKIGPVDVSSIWFRDLTVTGTACYGNVEFQGENVRTYQKAMDFLASGTYPTENLLTHVYPLTQWKDAFQAAFDKRTHRSMKVAIDMRGMGRK